MNFNRIHPIASKQVCDIKWLMQIRLLCGLYHNLNSSKLINIFAKTYCIAVTAFNISIVLSSPFISRKHTSFTIISYLWCSLYSLIKKEQYLFDYFKYDNVIDSMENPKPNKLSTYIKCLFSFIILHKIISIIYTISMIFSYFQNFSFSILLRFVFLGIFLTTCDLAFIPCYLINGLLYNRVKSLSYNLQKTCFGNSSANSSESKKCIIIYNRIFDGFEAVKDHIKYAVSVLIYCNNV